MTATKTILHPTDFSHHAAAALDVAAALARERHARLVILHVVPAAATYTCAGDVAAIRRAECAEQDLRSYREEMAERLRQIRPDGALAVEHLIRDGDVASEVLRVAEETNSGLVVLGTHGRTAQESMRFGSVAEAVVRRAHCPVVTVGGQVPAVRTECSTATPGNAW